nr:hypothetical protein BaRGS_003073 [Batillaria attramentaria]
MHRVKHKTQVVAGLQFGDYLNQPCYAAAARTGKTLTAVIMGVEWMRRNETVNILSGDRKSRAAAHHIKQQLEETPRLDIGPQAVSRVRLHLVHLDKDGAELAANVDKLVKTLTSSATNNEICLIADEASVCVCVRVCILERGKFQSKVLEN